MTRSDSDIDLDDLGEDEPDSTARDVLTSALREGHKWILGGFFVYAFYWAVVQPDVAISAAVVEGAFVILALLLFGSAVRSTTERADSVDAV